ncbi:hypothetical protein ETAA1_58490 [Urbifossiella limnaea]|uniref:Uncharacterized protein n=1 Tax=Urbifossiella limnaea TaxID=2528023 RepID=A0A517Y250_9BACT|nr:hypothetical protein ETAA1_58490 [Urbifossiella limnaea]
MITEQKLSVAGVARRFLVYHLDRVLPRHVGGIGRFAPRYLRALVRIKEMLPGPPARR